MLSSVSCRDKCKPEPEHRNKTYKNKICIVPGRAGALRDARYFGFSDDDEIELCIHTLASFWSFDTISNLARAFPKVVTLNVSYCFINEQSFSHFENLLMTFPAIKTLIMHANALYRATRRLCAFLSERDSNIRELGLDSCSIRHLDDWRALAELVRTNRRLRWLSLMNNGADDGVAARNILLDALCCNNTLTRCVVPAWFRVKGNNAGKCELDLMRANTTLLSFHYASCTEWYIVGDNLCSAVFERNAHLTLTAMFSDMLETILPLFFTGLPVYVLLDVFDWYCFVRQADYVCRFDWASVGIDVLANHKRREKAEMLFALFARYSARQGGID